MKLEQGAAGININLTKGVITIRHCEGGVLVERSVTAGTWSEMWEALNFILDKNTFIQQEDTQ